MSEHIAAHFHHDLQERALLGDVQKGDPAAISLLFDRYAPALLGVISRIVNDPHKAESLLQAVFIRIRIELTAYDPEKIRLFTWMLGIARSTALESLDPPGVPEIRGAENTVNTTAAFELVYLKGYSLTRAAQMLGLSRADLVKRIRMELTNLRATQ